jgi:hypothetical protein
MAESLQQPSDVASDYATTRFIIESLLSKVSTCTLVRVVACTNEGGLSPVGTVDVQPLVNQIAGDGSPWPHGQLYKLPYCRAQGGTNAVILDPQPGDFGLVVFRLPGHLAIKSRGGKAQAPTAARGAQPGQQAPIRHVRRPVRRGPLKRNARRNTCGFTTTGSN